MNRRILGKLAVFIVYATLFSYIVFGNAFTFDIANRMPLKTAEIVSVVTFVFYIVYIFIRNIKIGKKIRDLSFFKNWIFLWIVVGTLAAFIKMFIIGYSFSQLSYGLLYIARIIHIVLLAKIIADLVRFEKMNIERLLNFIVICFVIVCFIGFFQYIFYPIAYDWYGCFYKIGSYWPIPDPHQNRLLSTYFDPNYLASILIIPIFIQSARLVFNKGNKKIVYIITIAIFVLTILLTKSRSGIVGIVSGGFALVICFGLQRKMKKKTIALMAVLIPIAILVLCCSNITVFQRILNVTSDPSAHHRFNSWRDSIIYIMQNPFIGTGYNMFGAYQEILGNDMNVATGYGVDSSVLFIFITTGFIGGGIFLYGMYKIFRKKKKSYLDASFKCILFASIMMSFFNNLLFNVLWILPIAFIGYVKKEAQIDFVEVENEDLVSVEKKEYSEKVYQ